MELSSSPAPHEDIDFGSLCITYVAFLFVVFFKGNNYYKHSGQIKRQQTSMGNLTKIIGILLIVISISTTIQSFAQDQAVSENVKRQIKYLQSGSSRQKIEAAQNLSRMGAEAVPSVPYLIELLGTSLKYKNILNRIWNTVTIFGNSGDSVAWESRLALIRIGNPAVGQLSTALLNHSKPNVRRNVAIALGEIKDAASIESLTTALQNDKDDKVRVAAAAALGKMAEKWSGDLLSDAATALMAALKDKNQDVRQKAVWALGRIKAMKAVPALIEAMQIYGKDSNAGSALVAITGQRLGDDTQKWQEWWEVNKQ
jgi:HEAT repeat protein